MGFCLAPEGSAIRMSLFRNFKSRRESNGGRRRTRIHSDDRAAGETTARCGDAVRSRFWGCPLPFARFPVRCAVPFRIRVTRVDPRGCGDLRDYKAFVARGSTQDRRIPPGSVPACDTCPFVFRTCFENLSPLFQRPSPCCQANSFEKKPFVPPFVKPSPKVRRPLPAQPPRAEAFTPSSPLSRRALRVPRALREWRALRGFTWRT